MSGKVYAALTGWLTAASIGLAQSGSPIPPAAGQGAPMSPYYPPASTVDRSGDAADPADMPPMQVPRAPAPVRTVSGQQPAPPAAQPPVERMPPVPGRTTPPAQLPSSVPPAATPAPAAGTTAGCAA